MISRIVPILLVLLLAGWGCGSSVDSEGDTGTDTDAPSDSTDMGPDRPPDTTPDTGPEVTPDTGPDTVPDTGPDGGPDGGMDTGPDTGPSGEVGDPCTTDGDCGLVPSSGVTCLRDIYGAITFPGGYCSATDCTSDTDCGTVGECVDFMGYAAYCLRTCTTDGDCRISEGYSCTTVPGSSSGATYCLPPLGGPDGGPIDT
jgi:hypothetical protein